MRRHAWAFFLCAGLGAGCGSSAQTDAGTSPSADGATTSDGAGPVSVGNSDGGVLVVDAAAKGDTDAATSPCNPSANLGRGCDDMAGSAPVDMAGAQPADLANAQPVDMANAQPADMANAQPVDMANAQPVDMAMAAPADLAMKPPVDMATPPPADLAMKPPVDMATPPPADMAQAGGGGGPDWVFYGAQDGLMAAIVDASPDEAGNIWAAANDALYIRRPKDGFFRRYTNADGLHIYSFATAVAGAGANEGFLGLEGYDSDTPNSDPQPLPQYGKAEHVHLMSDGSIVSLQYAMLHNDNSSNYWETRSARRLLYVHTGAYAGHLFMGGNHGITHILNDGWGDHIHVDVTEPNGSQLLGEFYGLALDPTNNYLWTCGRYACGRQKYYADPKTWVGGVYDYAFTVWTSNHDLSVPYAYHEDHVGTAIATNGVVYFASKTNGIGSWNPATGNYGTIKQHETVNGLGAPVDIVADPDGTMWVTDGAKLLRWNPSTGATSQLSVPSSDIRRLYMDTLSSPRALYISTGNGIGVYRGK